MVPGVVSYNMKQEKLQLHVERAQRVLIIHPFLQTYGGAEYMLSVLANEVFPNVDIFTFAWERSVLQRVGLRQSRVRSPFGNSLPKAFVKVMSFLLPALVDSYIFKEYDLIISLSYGYVHGFITNPDQTHISFILTPMRKLWIDDKPRGFFSLPGIKSLYQDLILRQRQWDFVAAARPDMNIAISKEVSDRIEHFWRRSPEDIIYPPVDIDFYKPKKELLRQDIYVTHARLVKHKNIDLIVKAFIKLQKALVVMGNGPELKFLKNLANGQKNIQFKGFVTDTEKKKILQTAKGYIFAGDEDFGIATVEAIAAGLPVLALRKGGSKEIVQENINGCFFDEQTVDSLIGGFITFENKINKGMFGLESLSQSIALFNKDIFIERVRDLVGQVIKKPTTLN